jgi:hypothetical protein
MYPRVEDFKAFPRDYDDAYDPERGLRRGRSRYSRTFFAIVLLALIVAAILFGGIVVLWTSEDAGRAWMGKSGEPGWLQSNVRGLTAV